MSFEETSKAWALKQLQDKGIEATEVDWVDFELEHDCCMGHGDQEYCYCDTSARVIVSAGYFVKGPRGGKVRKGSQVKRGDGYELGSLIREISDYVPQSE